MSEIKTWQERVEYPDHGLGIRARDAAIDAEITDLRTALAARDAELTKAQDELNCTEVELEVAACDMPEEKFNQGFECMGDFVRAVSEGYKAALAERDVEIERLTKTGALDLQKVASMVDELTTLRATLAERDAEGFDTPGLEAFGLQSPTPRAYAAALRKHWEAVCQKKVDERDAELTTLRAAAQQVLDAFKYPQSSGSWFTKACKERDAIAALTAALEKKHE